MRKVSQTRQFSRDLKRVAKRGKDLGKLKRIVTFLAKDKPLAPRHRDHALTGNWKHSRDCHVEPDWLLIYTVDDESLRLERTGMHSDLLRSRFPPHSRHAGRHIGTAPTNSPA